MNKLHILLVPFFAAILLSCNESEDNPQPAPTTGDFIAHFDIKWDPMNGVDLDLGKTYPVASGDSIRINEVRMWVSNVKLFRDGQLRWTDTDSYYLVERRGSGEREMVRFEGVPTGNYDRIEFAIGVDSVANAALENKAGELEAGIGMDWNWNTGYKFYVINGFFLDDSTNTYENLRVHLGLNKYFTEFSLDLPVDLNIKSNDDGLIHMMVPVMRSFNAPNVIALNGTGGGILMSDTRPEYGQIQQNLSTSIMVHHVE